MTEMEKARAGLEFIRGDATLRSIRERALNVPQHNPNQQPHPGATVQSETYHP